MFCKLKKSHTTGNLDISLSFGFGRTNLESGIAVVVTAKVVVDSSTEILEEVSSVEAIIEVLLVPFEAKIMITLDHV